jgi:hypothetical protein
MQVSRVPNTMQLNYHYQGAPTWFQTLNDALKSEGLLDVWPVGVTIDFNQSICIHSGAYIITMFRDSTGRYQRPNYTMESA